MLWARRPPGTLCRGRHARELTARHSDRLSVTHWLESVQGLPTAAHLVALIAAHRDHSVCLCGPQPFMDAVHDATARAGIPRNRVHAETFTSLSGDPFAEVTLPEAAEDAADAAIVSVGLDGVATAHPTGSLDPAGPIARGIHTSTSHDNTVTRAHGVR